ncbi:MAG: DUF456 domain-containing protein [Jiangellaceae bacterium]
MPFVEPIGLVLVGAAIVVGLVGIVLVVLPGLLLVWGAVAVWALVERSTLAWGVLVLATVLAVAGTVIKYMLPGRRMRESGVPTRSIVVGALLGIVGFFVIPVVGLFIGFVLGVYLAERVRLGRHADAWPSTVHAMKAVGLSILIELLAGMLIAATWVLAATVG